jgi:hypothetical protein
MQTECECKMWRLSNSKSGETQNSQVKSFARLTPGQGDWIGRIFAQWAIVNFGRLLKNL